MSKELIRFRKDVKLTFLDFETLNLCLNFCHNLPWQAALLRVKGEEILDSANIYIKWDTDLKVSDAAAAMNHYNQRTIDSIGISSEKAFEKIYSWIEESEYVVGHNTLGFDLHLLINFYKMYGKSTKHLSQKFIDTNTICKGIKLGIPYSPKENFLEYQYRMYSIRQKGLKTKMALMATEYGIEFDESLMHSADYDLKINKKLWDKIKYQIEL